MVGLLPSTKETEDSKIEIEVEVKKPDYLLEKYRVFIQDRGSGSRHLPKGSTILIQDEVAMYDIHLIHSYSKYQCMLKSCTVDILF